MAVLIATSPRPSLRGRLRRVAALGALGCAAALILDLGSQAQADCQLGGTCTVDVTAVGGFPGVGTATQTTPLQLDLTELNADGSGKVTGVVPEGAVTFDLDKKTKTVSTKRKKGKRVTTFKPDKKAKSGVKVKASKPR
jgi:hypothetical protein